MEFALADEYLTRDISDGPKYVGEEQILIMEETSPCSWCDGEMYGDLQRCANCGDVYGDLD